MSNPLDLQFDDFFGGEGGEAFTESSFFPDVEERYFMDAPGSFFDATAEPNTSYAQDFYSGTQDQLNLRADPLSAFIEDRGFSEGEIYPETGGDSLSIAEKVQESIFGEEGVLRGLGLGAGAIKDVQGFFKGARKGIPKQAQGQGRGRIGPGLTTSTPRTSAAGRTSRARQATSGERAVQAAISQSNRAQSAARAIANQMARAGTYATNNDIADLISGSTSPKGTKQALPGTRLRQLAIPRTA